MLTRHGAAEVGGNLFTFHSFPWLPFPTEPNNNNNNVRRVGRVGAALANQLLPRGRCCCCCPGFLGTCCCLLCAACNKGKPVASPKMGRRVALAINSAIFRRSTTSLGYRRSLSCQIILQFLPIHLSSGRNPAEWPTPFCQVRPTFHVDGGLVRQMSVRVRATGEKTRYLLFNFF